MKKLVLAAAVAAIAGNAMAFEAYNADGTTVSVSGEVRTRLQHKSDDGKASLYDMDGSKLKVKVTHDMSEDLTVAGFLGYKMDLNQGSSEVKVDKGYLALSSDTYGAVAIGRMGTVHDDLMGSYDASTLYGGDAKFGDDFFGSGSAESAIGYKWSNDSFTVLAQTLLAKNDENVKLKNNDDDVVYNGALDSYMAIGGQWVHGSGLTLTASLTDTTIATATANRAEFGKYVDAMVMGFEADYAFGAWTVGGAFTNTTVESNNDTALDSEFDGMGIAGSYTFENGIKAFAGYDVIEGDHSADYASFEDKTTYNVGVEYRPIKNIKTFAEFANVSTDFKTKKDTDIKKYGIGVRAYF